MNLKNQHVKVGVAVCLMAASLNGCTIRFVSDYDEQTDKSVTALQKNVETFLVKLENNDKPPACFYDKHKVFYEVTTVDLSGIRVRAAAMPNNTITTQQLELLSKSISNLETLHKIKEGKKSCLTKQEIEPIRINLNSSFTAILKLELAKRRGETD